MNDRIDQSVGHAVSRSVNCIDCYIPKIVKDVVSLF